jgi:hypothetical protein
VIYISSGMEKSGSTLTYNLTRFLLEAAGCPHIQLSAEVRQGVKVAPHVNHVREFTPEVVADVIAATDRAGPGSILSLRTYAGPTSHALEMFRVRKVRHHITIQDPRDIALSLMEAARRRESIGRPLRRRSDNLEDTFSLISAAIERVSQWASIEGALLLRYEETASSHKATIDNILRQLQLALSRAEYESVFAKAVGMISKQFNVRAINRYRREMSAEDQQLVIKTFPAFYQEYFTAAEVIVEDAHRKPVHDTVPTGKLLPANAREGDEEELFQVGRLVPKRSRALIVGKGAVRLADGLGNHALAVELDNTALMDIGANKYDVGVLLGRVEDCNHYLPLAQAFAANGLPLIYSSKSVQSELRSPVGAYITSLSDIVRFSRVADDTNVCFAVPRRSAPLSPWLERHVQKLTTWGETIRQRRENAEQREGGVAFGTSWNKRDRIVAGLVPAGLAIADVGCGDMTSEKLLRPRLYIPIDVAPRDRRTIVVDLNSEELPEKVKQADLVLFLGVLEYVADPIRHLAKAASFAKRMVVTYNVFEKRSRLMQVTAGRWKSDLTSEDLRHAFADLHYDVETFLVFGRQSLYIVKPEGHPPLTALLAGGRDDR